MKKFFILLCFCFSIHADKKIDLSSKKASYDGKKINLEGKVFFNHPLGKITARKASAFGFLQNRPSTILLDKEVELTLTKGGSITSEKALFNNESQKIDFLKVKKKIVYSDSFNQKNGQALPFTMSCNKAFCNINPEKPELINFYDDVMVDISQMHIKGERGIIFKDEILLLPKSENTSCLLEGSKVKINASSLKLLPQKGEIVLEKPVGSYANSCQFKSSSLVLFENEKKLSFLEDVFFKSKEASLSCPRLDLYFNEKEIEKIETSKNVKISFLKNKNSQITSQLPLIFNPLKKEIFSAEEEFSYIIYQDDEMTIFAKKLFLILDNDHRIQKATLEKDVYFTSKTKDFDSYGLADKVVFLPSSNFISLESSKGKKVLFYRNDNSISLSADKIEIFHQKGHLQDKVKGVGTVRFLLNVEEKKLFNNLFLKYKKHYD